jgi:hypothetical protein
MPQEFKDTRRSGFEERRQVEDRLPAVGYARSEIGSQYDLEVRWQQKRGERMGSLIVLTGVGIVDTARCRAVDQAVGRWAVGNQKHTERARDERMWLYWLPFGEARRRGIYTTGPR